MGWSISDENEMRSQNVGDGPGIVFGVEEILLFSLPSFLPLPVFTLSA